jgi:hypothetical protein
MKVEVSQGMKPKIGLTFGVAYNHEISNIISLQPELSFIQKGFRQKYRETQNGATFDIDGKFAINYLELPILVKASFGESKVKFYVNAGPSIGLGLGGKYEVDYIVSILGYLESDSAEGDIKFGDSDNSGEGTLYLDNRMDLGLQVGGGVVISEKIMLDLRYGHGLTSLNDESNDDVAESKNRVFQFTVGYPIRIK